MEAAREYAAPARPFLDVVPEDTGLSSQQREDDVLDLADVTGKRIVTTTLHHNVTVREENATAALEIMSRFAAKRKWLVYLPPTVSPSETTKREGYLEYPTEAFAYYRNQGIERVVCEEKHMGSRAVVVLCRTPYAARRRFGVVGDEVGTSSTKDPSSASCCRCLARRWMRRARGTGWRPTGWCSTAS